MIGVYSTYRSQAPRGTPRQPSSPPSTRTCSPRHSPVRPHCRWPDQLSHHPRQTQPTRDRCYTPAERMLGRRGSRRLGTSWSRMRRRCGVSVSVVVSIDSITKSFHGHSPPLHRQSDTSTGDPPHKAPHSLHFPPFPSSSLVPIYAHTAHEHQHPPCVAATCLHSHCHPRLWTHRVNHGRFCFPFDRPPRSDREDSEGGSSAGTSGGG
jgi:hypothetical protein